MPNARYVLLVGFVIFIAYTNCGKPNVEQSSIGGTSKSSEEQGVDPNSLYLVETSLLKPEITQRLVSSTGENAAVKTSVDMRKDSQDVTKLLSTRLYGSFEGAYSKPMTFLNLKGYKSLGFFVDRSSVSGSVVTVFIDGKEVAKLDYPGSTSGSLVVQTLNWIRLPENALNVELKITNDVGVVVIPHYIISKLSPIELHQACASKTSELCTLVQANQYVIY